MYTSFRPLKRCVADEGNNVGRVHLLLCPGREQHGSKGLDLALNMPALMMRSHVMCHTGAFDALRIPGSQGFSCNRDYSMYHIEEGSVLETPTNQNHHSERPGYQKGEAPRSVDYGWVYDYP